MSDTSFVVIGIPDSDEVEFSSEVRDIIASAKVFSGGRRHHELVRGQLPADAEWIDITVPITATLDSYRGHRNVVVFASGDPLFYGFANTLLREFPEAYIKVVPYFNSLQILSHRILQPYHDMSIVSLTGRPWSGLDTVLIERKKLIGVLTDKEKTPSAIASYLLKNGFDYYTIIVGEKLGNKEEERITEMDLEEAAHYEAKTPNCLILRATECPPRIFGIPEKDFYHLDGREKMITKMPVRLLSLSMLDPGRRTTMWDIGYCTGSVSIEAKSQFPRLEIVAFEKREESASLLAKNCRKFLTPGITGVTGDFMELDIDLYPRPDAVFIGGHGGHLKAMIQRIAERLLPGGVIVFNSVSEESAGIFEEGIKEAGLTVTECHRMALDDFNPIKIYKAQ